MWNKFKLIIIMFIALLSTACVTDTDEVSSEDETSTEFAGESRVELETEITTVSNDFVQRLGSAVENNSTNYVISPVGIKIALGILANGAAESEQSSILHAIEVDGIDALNTLAGELQTLDEDTPLRLGIHNSLWTDKDTLSGGLFSDKYKEMIEQFYSVDMCGTTRNSAAEDINKWVTRVTNNNLTRILDNSNVELSTWAVNTVRFRGNWLKSFNSQYNKEGLFTDIRGNVGTVTYMCQKGQFNFYDGNYTKILEMGFKDREGLSMYLILNNGNPLMDIREYQDKMRVCDVDVQIPKFTIESNYNLLNLLDKTGVSLQGKYVNMFSSTDTELTVNKLLHTVYLSVSEAGIGAQGGSQEDVIEPQSEVKEFVANTPFSFILYDRDTDSVWEMGEYAYLIDNNSVIE